MNTFFDELDKMNIENQEAQGAHMAWEYTELLENSELSYGQLRRSLKEEMLKLQAIQEAVKRREEVKTGNFRLRMNISRNRDC